MTQQTGLQSDQVSSQLAVIPISQGPETSQKLATLSQHAQTPQTRELIRCQDLLIGKTRDQAIADANQLVVTIQSNTAVLTVLGNDALEAVNRLNAQMLANRPTVDIPQLNEQMRNLSRQVRNLGQKYDPNDERARKRYQKFSEGVRGRVHFGKTFLQEFLADIQSQQKLFDMIIGIANNKLQELQRNIAYYDEFYVLTDQEIDRLVYKIGVMEILRDLLAKQASQIQVGDANLGDRGGEKQASILQKATLLENRIIAFKTRLWVAWAMCPIIRNLRANSVGLSERINETIGITIPTLEGTIVVWLSLGEAEAAMRFTRVVEQTTNEAMKLFADAVKATVPAMANALATPALELSTIKAWGDSITAQADGLINALNTGVQKRADLEQAMVDGKQIIDSATKKVNEAMLQHVLTVAQEAPLEIVRSVPAQN